MIKLLSQKILLFYVNGKDTRILYFNKNSLFMLFISSYLIQLLLIFIFILEIFELLIN